MTKAVDINGITGEVVERDLNEHEIEVQKQLKEKLKTRSQNDANKAAARQAVLDKLGLTADEAAALLGQFGNTGNVDRLRNNTRQHTYS